MSAVRPKTIYAESSLSASGVRNPQRPPFKGLRTAPSGFPPFSERIGRESL